MAGADNRKDRHQKPARGNAEVTITSSKKVSKREAIVLVYRALALEGFTAVESAQSILIVPEGQEPRIGAELVTGPANSDLPEGRVRVVKKSFLCDTFRLRNSGTVFAAR